jgi:regulator of sigma E protease
LLLTIVAFVFVLGVLIFVHELGHFLMARRVGVRVITFSLGFGPKLVGFRRGDTEYRVSAVPLGGYVKMAGETPDDPRTGQPDEFLSKTKWQRFQVFIMGPLMNILLAIALMWVVLMQGDQEPSFLRRPPKVGAIAAGSPAERGGVKPGDVIVTVAGRRVDTWEQLSMAIGTKARREVAIEVVRDGRTVPLSVTPDAQTKYEIGDIGVFPDVHPSIVQVVAGEAAERGGLKSGDIVLAFNGQTITYVWQLMDAIAKHPNQVVVFDVQRGAERRSVSVTPALQGKKGRVGVTLRDDVIAVKRGPWEAAKLSVQRNYESGGDIFRTLVGLLTRETSPKQLTGPLGIAQLSGDAAALGWTALFGLMAMISLNLGILNLLPIPVLDGGHIFIMALEGLARRDFSTKVKESLLLAGFAVLMVLMVTVIYNDLTRVAWISRLMFWR